MSTDYGIFCMDCNRGYLTNEHHSRKLADFVAAKQQVEAAVRAVNELNKTSVSASLVCDELWGCDKELVLDFVATHHAHDLQVLDEYEFRDLGWVGNDLQN